ncbi:uncharacterized protein LOC113214938 [Frankliniella occidentalis]|uniref:Uncharacterized protein LOC113214938 n=1 Tax=Frankliniella occidentalis TaxID=133901 RepID=A0A6J1TEV5_FRAOC|nr:uncharacterized protein LOC113214938 [Frankliniella occidentalis]
MRIASPKPVTVISDMEVGIINATKTIFSDAEIRLCLFHVRQAAWRHLQEGGLQVAYRNQEDDSIRNAFREVVGLAFVPVDDVKEACEVVIDNLPVRMADFGDYFEKTYVIGHRNRGTRQTVPPRYPPALWNQYIAAVENQPRTNNANEAWHNRFQTIVGKSHPSLYKLIGAFQKEAADVKVMMEELDAGRKIRQQQKAKYSRINDRLQTLTRRYQEFKATDRLLDYVRGCGANVSL